MRPTAWRGVSRPAYWWPVHVDEAGTVEHLVPGVAGGQASGATYRFLPRHSGTRKNVASFGFLYATIPPLPADNLDFVWDRPEMVATLRARLQSATGTEWLRTAAWLMREARLRLAPGILCVDHRHRQTESC